MNTRFSPVLWDLDGTILDSGPEIRQRVARVVREFGYPEPTTEQLTAFIGPPLVESYERIIGMTPEQAQRAFLRSREIAKTQAPDYLVTLHKAVAELVKELHAAGVPQSVASSKGQWAVEQSLQHFGLAECFDVLCGADPQQQRIHKHDVIAYVLDHYRARNIDVSNGVIIGDRIHDLEGGLAHNLSVIIVEWGYGAGEETPGAFAKVANIAQLRSKLLL